MKTDMSVTRGNEVNSFDGLRFFQPVNGLLPERAGLGSPRAVITGPSINRRQAPELKHPSPQSQHKTNSNSNTALIPCSRHQQHTPHIFLHQLSLLHTPTHASRAWQACRPTPPPTMLLLYCPNSTTRTQTSGT
jgi:hypothetical protein